MDQGALIAGGLVAVVGIAVVAQWTAHALRIPSILLLLIAGLIAGPLLGILEPRSLLGATLEPFIALSVALILFEGGLSLRLREISGVGTALVRIVTVGVAVTAIAVAVTAHEFAGLSWPIAVLFGCMLTVTGPTVIGPLLRQVRARGAGAALLKWEGIVTDPLGVILAVLALEGQLAGANGAASDIARGAASSIAAGVGFGVVGAVLLRFLLRGHRVPDSLVNPVVTAVVLACWQLANLQHHEAGLITVTLIGIVLGNSSGISIRQVLEFKENVRVFLIGALFVLLTARIRVEDLALLTPGSFLFVACLVLVVRPASILVSTLSTSLAWRDRAFLCAVAPRGVVAASMASLFALRLESNGVEGAAALPPLMFLVILSTVTIYGLATPYIASRLGVADRDPQGCWILGAHPFARDLARRIRELGFEALLIDTNRENVRDARLEGLPVWHGSLIADDAIDDVPIAGVGRLLALTSNDEANSLSALRCVESFGRNEVYQLQSGRSGVSSAVRPRGVMHEFRGRELFAEGNDYATLCGRYDDGHRVVATRLTENFGFTDFEKTNPASVVLASVDGAGRLRFPTTGAPFRPAVGDTLLHLRAPTASSVANSPIADLAGVGG